MTDYIHLVGAEDVQRAASQMSSAASDMQRAADTIDNAVMQQQRFMDDWLFRFEEAIKGIRNVD